MAGIVLSHQLTRYADGRVTLSGTRTTIQPGEYVAVAGPEESGKSALLEAIAMERASTSAQTSRGGLRVARWPELATPHGVEILDPTWTVRDYLSAPLLGTLHPSELARRVDQTARELGLGKELDRPLRQLSGGQRARVALGGVLNQHPDLVLIDDPARALLLPADEIAVAREVLRRRGIAALHATADPGEAFYLADRVAIMIGDRIHQIGTPDEVRSQPANVAVADFVTGGLLNLLHGIWDGETLLSPYGPIEIPRRALGNARPGQAVVAGLRPRQEWPRPAVRALPAASDPTSPVPVDRVAPAVEQRLTQSHRTPAVLPIPAVADALTAFDDATGVNLGTDPTEHAPVVSAGVASSLLVDAPQPRYVNVTMRDPKADRTVPQTERLERATSYEIAISIGALAADSVVTNPEAFPSHLLPQSNVGHWLEFIAASVRFQIAPQRHRMFLPLTGAAWVCTCRGDEHVCSAAERRPSLWIAVRTPADVGPAAVRLSIYHKQHLVQSQLITARVGLGPDGVSHSSTIDYSLTADLKDVGGLPARPLSILVNEGSDGAHQLVVNGRELDPFFFTVSDGQMRNASEVARQILLSAHFDRPDPKNPKTWNSRYDDANRKAKADFVSDLTALARAGWQLLTLLFPQEEPLRQLRELLRTDSEHRDGGAVIQVGYAGGRQGVLPWALAYDIPIQSGNAPLTACQFLAAWTPGDEFPALCPHRAAHAFGTLCPYGFWGIAHVIETLPRVRQGASLPLWIADRAPQRRLLIGLSRALAKQLSDEHLDAIAALGLQAQPCTTFDEVGKSLGSYLEVAYFYCHGKREAVAGSADPLPALEVGTGELIRPADLQAWAQGGFWPANHWPDVRPLAFINGCHTTELTPDLLGDFVRAFVGVRAAGVIGTEVSITQRVANEAAKHFLGLLYEPRATVGTALQGMRRRLLAKANVMGLAYTPYCSASLTITRAAP